MLTTLPLRVLRARSLLTAPLINPRHYTPIPRLYSTTSSPHEDYDILIIGGGPAGLLLASALRSSPLTSPLRLALLDSQPLTPTPPPTSGFSNRAVSLTPSSLRFLTQIGATPHLDQSRTQPYTSMRVTDGISGAAITFSPELLTTHNEIATMCEVNNLTTALHARITELGGVELIGSTKVQGIQHGIDEAETDFSTWPVVHTDTGRRLRTRLLVGADGANSPVRSFAGIETRGWDYGQHAVVATLHLEPAAAKTAYQRFLPTGPIALLPMPGDYASLVWSTTPAHAASLKKLAPVDFVAMVNAALRLRAVDVDFMCHLSTDVASEVAWRESATPLPPNGPFVPRVVGVQDGSRAGFPLKMRHADTYHGERVALVGDAAHSMHPLAGQGLNLGIADVESLVGTVERAVGSGMDVGTVLALEGYTGERYWRNHVMLGVVDKLQKLYGTDAAAVVGVRSLGLGIVDRLEGLKGFIMREAAGRG